MAEQLSTFWDDVTEECRITLEFSLPLHKSLSFLLIPECSSDSDITVRAVSAEGFEHVDVALARPAHSIVSNAMHIDDAMNKNVLRIRRTQVCGDNT